MASLRKERTEDSNLLLNSVVYSNDTVIMLVVAVTTKWEDNVC